MSTGQEEISAEFRGHTSAGRTSGFPDFLQNHRQLGPEWEEDETPTLLHLIEAVAEVTNCDREVVATVAHMLNSGRVLLRRPARNEQARLTFGHA